MNAFKRIVKSIAMGIGYIIAIMIGFVLISMLPNLAILYAETLGVQLIQIIDTSAMLMVAIWTLPLGIMYFFASWGIMKLVIKLIKLWRRMVYGRVCDDTKSNRKYSEPTISPVSSTDLFEDEHSQVVKSTEINDLRERTNKLASTFDYSEDDTVSGKSDIIEFELMVHDLDNLEVNTKNGFVALELDSDELQEKNIKEEK